MNAALVAALVLQQQAGGVAGRVADLRAVVAGSGRGRAAPGSRRRSCSTRRCRGTCAVRSGSGSAISPAPTMIMSTSCWARLASSRRGVLGLDVVDDDRVARSRSPSRTRDAVDERPGSRRRRRAGPAAAMPKTTLPSPLVSRSAMPAALPSVVASVAGSSLRCRSCRRAVGGRRLGRRSSVAAPAVVADGCRRRRRRTRRRAGSVRRSPRSWWSVASCRSPPGECVCGEVPVVRRMVRTDRSVPLMIAVHLPGLVDVGQCWR